MLTWYLLGTSILLRRNLARCITVMAAGQRRNRTAFLWGISAAEPPLQPGQPPTPSPVCPLPPHLLLLQISILDGPFFLFSGGGAGKQRGDKAEGKRSPRGNLPGWALGGGDTSGLSPSSMHAALHLQHRALLLGLWG